MNFAPNAHSGKMGYSEPMPELNLVETDSRSRAVLPGRPNERFVLRENPDGSLLLQPARVVTEAQHEYDTDPELRELLARATASPTVRRARVRRT
ncbi:hypothetical protein E3G68_005178 [Mycobacteroides abscessus]|nr:hypothetical protein [Mycobacteroides abscessus]